MLRRALSRAQDGTVSVWSLAVLTVGSIAAAAALPQVCHAPTVSQHLPSKSATCHWKATSRGMEDYPRSTLHEK